MIDATECNISLDIPAVAEYLHIVSSTLNGMLTQETRPAEPDTLAYNVQTAVMEICKNIVQHLMNEVTYCRHLNGNYWSLVKKLHDTDDA